MIQQDGPSSRPDAVQPARKRRRGLIAAPLLTGAAAAAVAAGMLAAGLAGGDDSPAPAASGDHQQSATPFTKVASYTLKRDSDEVTLAITNPAGKIDLKALETEFERLGIPARVYAGDPNCVLPPEPSASSSTRPQPSPSQSSPTAAPGDGSSDIEEVDGKLTLRVRPAMIPDGYLLTVAFPLAITTPDKALSVITAGVVDEDEAIPCYPAAQSDTVQGTPPSN
jgi:hypothetical protein